MTVNESVELLRREDDYILVTHCRPDGDTLCSAAALCSALRRTGKKAAVLSNPETTENYAEYVKAYTTEQIPERAYIISIDLANVNLFPLNFSGDVDLCIDHHGSNGLYARKTLVMDEMAACGEIILRIIEQLCGTLTLEEANLLYIAVATDCGCFCYGNTRPQTLRDAAHIIEYGVNNGSLNKLLFRSLSYQRLKLEGMIFSSLRSYRDNKINVAVITRKMMDECGATENDCDDLASLAGKVKGNVVAITIRELGDGTSKASVRTNRTVNASEICARLGGGGHPMAAGCSAAMGPYELADKLVEITNEIWK